MPTGQSNKRTHKQREASIQAKAREKAKHADKWWYVMTEQRSKLYNENMAANSLTWPCLRWQCPKCKLTFERAADKHAHIDRASCQEVGERADLVAPISTKKPQKTLTSWFANKKPKP